MTIVYSGEKSTSDSTGRGGVIGHGDVQWMTAGAGILHEEFIPTRLPVGANWKWCSCGLTFNEGQNDRRVYQALPTISPTVTLPDNAGVVRVIAGRYEERQKAGARFLAAQCLG